tara:strand:- start:2452 stop:3693 length:1242 start_codon:yes stop_codon:yes gene_type:complete
MAKVSFDGVARQMNVLPGVTEIDVEIDLYSDWKEWMLLADNAKYAPAFRTFGGDQTSTSQFAPKYFFLLNGWKVVVDGETVVVQLNLYADDGSSPFLVMNSGAVSNRNSDASIVKDLLEESLDYAGRIHLDVSAPSTGVGYPFGTIAQPVNNLSDAETIGAERNIRDIAVAGHLALPCPVEHWNFFNWREGSLDLNGMPATGATFNDIIIRGVQNGPARFTGCQLYKMDNMEGIFTSCLIMEVEEYKIAAGVLVVMNDCRSAVAGPRSACLDLEHGGGIDLSMRAYSGGIEFIRSTDANNDTTCEFVAGKITMDASNTLGHFSFRGVADDSAMLPGPNVEIDIGGLMNRDIETVLLALVNELHVLIESQEAPPTAAEVSDVVWDEDLSSHSLSNSAAEQIKNLLTTARFLALK